MFLSRAHGMAVVLVVFFAGLVISCPPPPGPTSPGSEREVIVPELDPAYRGPPFPSLHIATVAGNIHRLNWANTTVSMYSPDGGAIFQGLGAQIRGRGNTTWFAMGDKRPFRIRFDQPRPMFGSAHVARDWTFIACALDYTLMRQYSAYFLGRMLGASAGDSGFLGPMGHLLHVYLDGEYRGVYMLSDQIQAGPGRAELTSNLVPELSEFLLEWCGRADHAGNPGGPEEFIVFVHIPNNIRRQDMPFVVDFPGGGVLRGGHGHMEFLDGFLNEVSLAIFERRGYAELSRLIDVESFVDFYIVQELFKNHDSFWSSLRFQIRQVEGRPLMFAGPVWDFDMSSGGGWDGSNDYSPLGWWTAHWNGWFNSLMRTGWFRDLVVARWSDIRNLEVAVMKARIRGMAETYRGCFERNFERWPVFGTNVFLPGANINPAFGVTPSVMALGSFMENVEYLSDWLGRRAAWLDANLGRPPPARGLRAEPMPWE